MASSDCAIRSEIQERLWLSTLGFDETSMPNGIESHLEAQLCRFGASEADPLMVAFSCGPDSLALLLAATHLRETRGLVVHACHVDHGLDSGSAARARQAERVATSLGLETGRHFHPVRLTGTPNNGDSVEAWARDRRYDVLRRLGRSLGGAWIATAHHADDQAETVLLRLLFGSGVAGLGGIRARNGKLIRPFLTLRKAELHRFVSCRGMVPVQDPTNDQLKVPRNRIRHCVLPDFKQSHPGLVDQAGRLAEAAQRAISRVERRLARDVRIESLGDGTGCELSRPLFVALPRELRGHALSAMDRIAGRRYPAPKSARKELWRQLSSCRGKVACDAGSGWRWYGDSATLRLLSPLAQPLPNFTYTLRAPGSVELAEIGVRATIRRGGFESWMSERHSQKVGFSLLEASHGPESAAISGAFFEIRNRRPGDRVQPIGSRRPKKLKDLLIDRRVPREQRDRLPIVVSNGQLIWVPGVALDERYRLKRGATNAWIIELHRLDHHQGIRIDDPSIES